MGELIRIYEVETDDNTGRIRTTLAFQPAEFRRVPDPTTGLATADVMDGGCRGAIVAPGGSRVAEADCEELALYLPGDPVGLSAADVWSLARREQMGFRFP